MSKNIWADGGLNRANAVERLAATAVLLVMIALVVWASDGWMLYPISIALIWYGFHRVRANRIAVSAAPSGHDGVGSEYTRPSLQRLNRLPGWRMPSSLVGWFLWGFWILLMLLLMSWAVDVMYWLAHGGLLDIAKIAGIFVAAVIVFGIISRGVGSPARLGKRNTRYIAQDVRTAVMRRDRGRCRRCGSKRDLQFDHKKPWSKGGRNTVWNIQLLCGTCNRRKGANW